MPILNLTPKRISKAQINYLLILFNDCGFSSASRASYIKCEFNKQYLDELTTIEAGKTIGYLKELRGDKS